MKSMMRPSLHLRGMVMGIEFSLCIFICNQEPSPVYTNCFSTALIDDGANVNTS